MLYSKWERRTTKDKEAAENSAKNCTSHTESQVVTDANLRIWLGLTPTPIGTAPPFYLEVAGRHQMPVLQGISSIEPSTELVTFSARLKTAPAGNSVVHFYENDRNFGRIFSSPNSAVTSISRFRAVITPDPTLFVESAEHFRIFSIWRSRAIGAYLEFRGLSVIPNIRWTTDSDLEAALAGIGQGRVIAVSNLGCYRSKYEKESFRSGLKEIISHLNPSQTVLYGTTDSAIQQVVNTRSSLMHQKAATQLYFEGSAKNG